MERQGTGHSAFHWASAVSAYFQGDEDHRAEPRVLRGGILKFVQRKGGFPFMTNSLHGDAWPSGPLLLLMHFEY